MSKDLIKQTGPKTLAGKQVASKNAQKGAIFTKGYLPTEDIELKQAQFELMCEQWQAFDRTRQLLLRTVEETSLCCERMMLAMQKKIEGKLKSLDIAVEFARQIGQSSISAQSMPNWYFKDGARTERALAKQLDLVWEETHQLKSRFTDQLAAQIAQQFPNLYAYIMEGQRSEVSFAVVLGQQYRQPTPILNLVALMNSIEEKYRHHLVWAQDDERYEAVIAGIRATQMLEAMDLEKSIRYATSFQNRILKGIHGLAIIDQYEAKTVQVMPPTGPDTDDDDRQEK